MKRKIFGSLVYGITSMAVIIIVALTIAILADIIKGGGHMLSWEFFTSVPKEGMTKGGIFPAIIGTVILVIIMSIAGVPIGVITAIYLNEYAKQGALFTKLIRFAVNTLAGVPSIVFGLFGLGFFIQFVGRGMDMAFQNTGNIKWGQPNILWASMTMALLTLPVVIVSVEEALKTVPREIREASLALGATKWETIWKIVLPDSMTGIMTGVILAIGRGAGEVAPILFTGAAYFLPQLPHSLSDQFMNLGYHIYIMSTQSTNVESTISIQYATVLVLLLVTFVLNLSAILLRYKLRSK
ncbi:MAG: phosphate ABC transporter permease PstA [Bacteroidota bacterium]|nr:phosphate ABC transporter permease PstA [Bacteroidota bacterium]MDP4193055.1 phosphate ABC transporter permease PstA [Bacteroidota bacterium]